MASPAVLRPIAHGATLVMHSLTKFISGHGDVTGGIVLGRREPMARVRDAMIRAGTNLGPFDAWLAARGARTLACGWSASAPRPWPWPGASRGTAAARVYYPGLPSHPQHALARLAPADGRDGGHPLIRPATGRARGGPLHGPRAAPRVRPELRRRGHHVDLSGPHLSPGASPTRRRPRWGSAPGSSACRSGSRIPPTSWPIKRRPSHERGGDRSDRWSSVPSHAGGPPGAARAAGARAHGRPARRGHRLVPRDTYGFTLVPPELPRRPPPTSTRRSASRRRAARCRSRRSAGRAERVVGWTRFRQHRALGLAAEQHNQRGADRPDAVEIG